MHHRLICKSMAVVAVILLAGCTATSQRGAGGTAEFLNSKQALERGAPFSEAVRAGDLLLLAGQIGNDDTKGTLVPGGIVPESRQVLTRIRNVLERNGSSLKEVVKCTVFLADMSEWAAFNSVYKEFFVQPFPARSAVGVNGLAMGARVEVECVAYAPAVK